MELWVGVCGNSSLEKTDSSSLSSHGPPVARYVGVEPRGISLSALAFQSVSLFAIVVQATTLLQVRGCAVPAMSRGQNLTADFQDLWLL